MENLISGWQIGGAFAVLAIGIAILFGLILLAYVLYTHFDSWRCPMQVGDAKVTHMAFVPAHREMVPDYDSSTEVASMVSVPVPDQWWTTIQIGRNKNQMAVPANTFEQLQSGDKVHAHYFYGRFSGALFVQEIFPMNTTPTDPGLSVV